MSKQTEWWHEFFSGLWLDIQRQYSSEERTSAKAVAIARMLGPKPGARVHDVPCGDGRLSLELASRGYRMTGVDITTPLVNDA